MMLIPCVPLIASQKGKGDHGPKHCCFHCSWQQVSPGTDQRAGSLCQASKPQKKVKLSLYLIN
jgi:hypothetical protein